MRLNKFYDEHQEFITIPRRPNWTTSLSTQELIQKEYENFLVWRRGLAKFQEENKVTLTPFEKNIEFWRHLWRVIERSDICVQILDARNPLLFLSKDLQKYVKEINPNKMNLILLNKADFLTEKQRSIWAEFFQNNNTRAVFFSALEQNNCSNDDKEKFNKKGSNEEECNEEESDKEFSEEMSDEEGSNVDEKLQKESSKDFEKEQETKMEDKTLSKNDTNTSVCETFSNSNRLLSREELIKYFKNVYGDIKKENDKYVTIGLVGYPNVGKSSTINALLQCKKTSVSATPGKTKHFQTLFIDNDLCLCDCPGLVFPNFVSSKEEMIINGILPIDQMTNHVPPVNLIASLIPKSVFETTYSIVLPETESNINSEQLLNAYGYMRGFMTQRGLPDNPRSARYLLKDFVNGKLLYCVAPPGYEQKDYHIWSLKKRPRPLHIPPRQERLLITDSQIEKEFDKNYFQQVNVNSHVKGLKLMSGYTQRVEVTQSLNSDENNSNSEALQGKPCKKHFNRNKKQKLRKKFAHLDIK